MTFTTGTEYLADGSRQPSTPLRPAEPEHQMLTSTGIVKSDAQPHSEYHLDPSDSHESRLSYQSSCRRRNFRNASTAPSGPFNSAKSNTFKGKHLRPNVKELARKRRYHRFTPKECKRLTEVIESRPPGWTISKTELDELSKEIRVEASSIRTWFTRYRRKAKISGKSCGKGKGKTKTHVGLLQNSGYWDWDWDNTDDVPDSLSGYSTPGATSAETNQIASTWSPYLSPPRYVGNGTDWSQMNCVTETDSGNQDTRSCFDSDLFQGQYETMNEGIQQFTFQPDLDVSQTFPEMYSSAEDYHNSNYSFPNSNGLQPTHRMGTAEVRSDARIASHPHQEASVVDRSHRDYGSENASPYSSRPRPEARWPVHSQIL